MVVDICKALRWRGVRLRWGSFDYVDACALRASIYFAQDDRVGKGAFLMTTSAAENLAGNPALAKKEEKVEKRRALGRGLESLLPGPRVVQASAVSHQPSAVGATSATADVGGG